MNKKQFILLVLIVLLVVLPQGCAKNEIGKVDLSPSAWPAGELEKYAKLTLMSGVPKPAIEAKKSMVVAAHCPLAIRAGVEALRQGGSAADAALTTALTQVCLHAGSVVSYAGIFYMLYYDAKTGKTYAMHAGWKTVKEETDPLSIPVMGTPSGRQVLVPGFMAGIEAAHRRFGKLPYSALFEPAIYFAEKGFPLRKKIAGLIKKRSTVLTRFPETKKIFSGENGELYKEGDILRQPQLARTLRKVADEGAGYMYRGEWAKKFIRTLRKEGSKMTLQDLTGYQVEWPTPSFTTYRDYDIYTLGASGFSAVSIIGAFNLLELSGIKKTEHYTRSGESLYQLIRISRMSGLYGFLAPNYRDLRRIFSKHIPTIDFSPQSWLSKPTAQLLWEKMQSPSWESFNNEIYLSLKDSSDYDEGALKDFAKSMEKKVKEQQKNKHSDCVVAVDEEGNIAAIVHTLNSGIFGLGLTIDGIIIPDSASFQQEFIAKVKPGERLLDPVCPLIIFKKGKPYLAAACIGALHEATLQCTVNVLDFDMDPQTAVETPRFLTPGLHPIDFDKQAIGEGQFSDEIIAAVRAMGQEIKILPPGRQWLRRGGWIGIRIDPATGTLKGGVPVRNNGIAAGN
jgi:gamma-glutamyltranspeptidase/glutathione hydrolase